MTKGETTTPTPQPGKLSKLQFYAIFGVLFLLVLLVAVGWTIIQARNESEPVLAEGLPIEEGPVEDGAAMPADQTGMVALVGNIEIPMLPSAGLDSTGQVEAPAESSVYLFADLSPTDATTWYQSALLGQGFTVTDAQAADSGEISFIATAAEGEQVAFEIRAIPDGRTALILSQGRGEGEAMVDEAILSEPVEAAPVESGGQDQAGVVSLVPDETSAEVASDIEPVSQETEAGMVADQSGEQAMPDEAVTGENGEIPPIDEALAGENPVETNSEPALEGEKEAAATVTETEVAIAQDGEDITPSDLVMTDTTIITTQAESMTEEMPTAAPDIPAPQAQSAFSSPWHSQITVMTEVTPTTIYAGMLNRLTYQMVMTGSGEVKIEVTLPEAVLIEPSRLPYDTNYDEAQRTMGWRVDLDQVSAYRFSFETITDLISTPGDLIFKTIAYPVSSTEEPTIEVSTVTSILYERTVDLTSKAQPAEEFDIVGE